MVGTKVGSLDSPCYRGALPLWDFLHFSEYFDVYLYTVFEVYRVGVGE